MKENERPAASECWDCHDDPAEKLKQMFVGIVQTRRIRQGQDPARRPVFLKPHGIAHGYFEMVPDLPADLKVGVFAQRQLAVWVRFSSDTVPTTPDLKTTCGIGIKLFGVPGLKLDGGGDTQDFVLQNSDVFFVDTAVDMCEFTRAGVVDGNYEPYLRTHPVTDRILKEMQKVESSVLTTTYWSGLPYSFGNRYVKYKLEPEQQDHAQPPDDPNYLAADLARRLRAGEARFRFLVQFQTDPATMPLDQATVRWDESVSVPVHVATLVLPRQDITALGQANYGENLSFNPWHSLKEHEPQGSISAARRVVYSASAEERRNANGVPVREPGEPRPAVALPPVPDDCIVRAAIYPAIGVARVGNSPEEFFLAPEVADPLPEPHGFYRDGNGALKRQAVRFRVYGLNAEGQPVAELTLDNAEIHWGVHLANKKAAWYQFQLALDIPEAAAAPPSLLRNAAVPNRADLAIDPGKRHISGRKTHGGPAHTFDTGKFMGTPVYLGELRTDEDGRLIVLGGHGKSASYNGTKAVTFANNEGWHDDVGDGPVTATVKFQGKELKVDPAWIVVAPPDYAPRQKSVRTMWDLMRDTAIQAKMLPMPGRPSFNRDIRPLFERMSNLQWVNAGYAASFGWKGPNNYSTPEWLERLSKNNPNDRELRQTIANEFRVFDRDSWAQQTWPWQYGDAMSIPPAPTPRQNASLTNTQLRFLQQWAHGDFDADYNPNWQPARKLSEVPVKEQPAMLDRASLEFCLADAFHPGCEMTWPMRTSTMYMSAFRILHAPEDWVEPSFGEELIQDTLSLPNGPLAAQVPGGISRWMAIPWQTDTASCRSGYQKTYDPYVPTFWPARVPNQVLTRENYEIIMSPHSTQEEKLSAFANRAAWIRPLGSKSYTDQINNMIRDYGDLGVVEERPGPGGEFPAEMQVENLPSHKRKLLMAVPGDFAHDADRIDLTGIEKVHRFPRGLK
ncbi:MAG TPA: LodA/GoxA family CTQ-dependent oxidase [Bryobacteraceae bacterium]|nr:LodA/GoxA family CTQ-dependent oxidase [Bryobacteraceae bacterium]